MRQAPPRESSDQPGRSRRNRPCCEDNCSLDEYLGAEGSARFDFDVDKDGNVFNVRLRQSSGNPEIDRKAEEAIRRRRYEASESGFQSQRIRVTSEQEGSDFQRQNADRRSQEEQDRAAREAERAA
ncbi:TonB family protein [Leptolyngbya sp. FACHB-17]|uniref:energy transducer TonB family protein n=1 Tax=unclassified Leptolyngbya TaxID=2650499 RepID=UPI0016805448|nr:energy transducer TonB [Leptolyngbya sp. FACHB-17]